MLELRNPATRRAKIQRLDVDQRFLDREHQQLATDYLGAALVPERDLARDLRVLIHAIHDLCRAEHEALPRKAIHDELAVIRAVVSHHHPRGEVVLLTGREGPHEDVLALRLTGQPHDDVSHERLTAARALALHDRDLPLIFPSIERSRIRHVEERVQS